MKPSSPRSFRRLPLVDYLSSLLTQFVHTDAIHRGILALIYPEARHYDVFTPTIKNARDPDHARPAPLDWRVRAQYVSVRPGSLDARMTADDVPAGSLSESVPALTVVRLK